jgi:hypothetical protein
MPSNTKLNEVKSMFSTFYNNFFFDNKDILGYLNDITAPGGNVFDATAKKILCLEINKNGEQLFRKNNQDTALAIKYDLVMSSIYAVIQSLIHIVRTSNNYYDIYQNIQKVKLLNTPASTEVARILKVIDPNLETKYMLDTDTLYIYDTSVINLVFNKIGYKYKEHMYDNITDDEIVSNNIFFMLSLNEYSLKSQLFAYYYYIIILKLFSLFYYNSEYLIDSGTTDSICEYFNNEFISIFIDLKNTVDAMISASGQNATLKEYNALCTGVCPISLDIIYAEDEDANNLIILNKEASIGDEYVVMIEQQITDIATNTIQRITYTYEINNATYISGVEFNYLKIPKTIILKATSTEARGCNIEGTYPSINIMQNETKLIKLRQKTVSDMRRDYILNGKELGSLNSNIIKSKDKINRMVKNYDKQFSMNKGIHMQMNIYKWIFIILSIIFIILFLGNFSEYIKLTTSYAIFVLILIMLIINYYIKYDYIEPFEVSTPSTSTSTASTVDTTECAVLTSSSPIANRLNFVQNNMTSFVEYALQLVVAYHLYLSSLDSLDLFKKMSGAMKTEMYTFKEHEKYYKYKEKMDNKTIDILKHDMIANTGYINMLTFMFLIITIFCICYFYNPEYIKSYIIIALVLCAINLSIYYLIVLRPVRTHARNNYWSKPSQATMVNF